MLVRHLTLCIVVVVVAVLVLPAAAADDKPDKKKKDEPVIAHIRLAGELDEAPVGEGIFGATGENLRMKLERIKKAKNDPNVKALLVEIDGLHLGLFGFGKVEEVRRAIADFHQSGKKCYAYLEEASGIDYLIALACDEVYLPPPGSFEFLGLRIEMSFYKELLDKIGIKADFLQMGEAKGAAEPFTRTSMSPENRKQYELVLDDFYQNGIVQTIIASRPARKWSADDVKKLIDDAPYTAHQAKDLGLVDQMAYRDELEDRITKDLKIDGLATAKDYGKTKADLDENPFSALMKLMSPPKKKTSSKPKIAVVYAVGPIVTGKGGEGLFGGGAVGSTTMVQAIRKAEEDETVKAIVLRVDSPGGSALASDLIWHELRKSKKPTIASMGDIAASGGYYISMGCKKVYAEPGTLTGSIGVVGGKIVTHGLEEWIGVRTEVLSRGKNTGIRSMTFEFSKTERDAIGRMMQDIYDQFLDKTVENRTAAGVSLTKEKLLPLAGGRIWTGRQAKERGLVDELGTLADAVAEAKKQANLAADSEPELLILPEPTNILDRLLEGELGARAAGLLNRLSTMAGLDELRQHLRAAEGLLRLRGEKVWLTAPYSLRVR
jgi:protease-4